MSHRFFSVDRSDDTNQIMEVTQDELPTLTNVVVWELDPNLFPLQTDQEIVDYFTALYLKPSTTRLLPGFDTIRTS